MSVIRNFPFISHYLGSANTHVVHLNNGTPTHQGIGQSFWFRPQTSVLSEVPATDQEQPIMFHVVTRDQQDVTVQSNVTYRFADAVLASQRLDFGIFPARKKGEGEADGRQRVAQVIGQSAQSIALNLFATLGLAETLDSGIARLHAALVEGLSSDPRLASSGIQVLGVRVLSVRPEADVEKALQTPVRERLQAEADRATYERRALAVERERTISENELASKIELAKRRENLVAQEGANAQREAQEAAASELITARSNAEREQIQAQARAQRQAVLSEAAAAEIRLLGEAEALKADALMKVQIEAGAEILMALALQTAAENLPEVGSITVTPDMLAGLLGKFTGNPDQRAA